MAFPWMAAITAGLQTAGNIYNTSSQVEQNKKNREWNEMMYERQKSDSIDFWNMQNSYNSPEAQMARLQKADLNPNLVYGNGSAVNTASAPSTPHAMPFKGEAPQVDMPNIVGSYFNIQTQMQQLDNMKKQGDLLEMDKNLKQLDAVTKGLNNTFLNRTMEARDYALRNNASLGQWRVLNEAYSYEQMRHLNKQRLEQTIKAISLDNSNRVRTGRNLDMTFDINSIRKQMLGKQADSSMAGMTLKDWLNLIVNGASLLK